MTRTYSREHWEAAQLAWTEGRFSDEWKPYRHEAAMKGIIYPPDGTALDQWDDDDPSGRALLIRAIRETPNLLHRAISARKSWAGIAAYVIHERDDWAEELRRAERREAEDRDEADPHEATVALKRIIERIRES
jgi:hypothetical protein